MGTAVSLTRVGPGAAVVLAMNEHDGSIRALVRRFVLGGVRPRSDSGPTSVERREPVPCCSTDAGRGGAGDVHAAGVDGSAVA